MPVLVCRRVSLCFESFQGVQAHPPGLWFLQARQAGAPGPRHSVASSFYTRKPAGLPSGKDFTVPRPRAAQLAPSSQSRGQDPALGPDAGVMHLKTLGTSSLSRSPWILCLSPTRRSVHSASSCQYMTQPFSFASGENGAFPPAPMVRLGVLHALG